MAGKKDNYSPNSQGGFGNFLYNSDTGAILGRTCGSWSKFLQKLLHLLQVFLLNRLVYILRIALWFIT